MHPFETVKALLRQKSGKKLIVISVILFLLITALVFFVTFYLCREIQLKQMDEYLWEISQIMKTRDEEVHALNQVYDGKLLTSADVGLKLYTEETTRSEADHLLWVRDMVFADSVSVVDEQRNVISTTGIVIPQERFQAVLQTLEPRRPQLELYPVLSADGKDTGKEEGKSFVLLPLPGSGKQSLVFEFPCEEVLEMYEAIGDNADILKRILPQKEYVAYAKTGNEVTGFPMDNLAEEEAARLEAEVTKAIEEMVGRQNAETGTASKLSTLMGRLYLTAMARYSLEGMEDTDILLADPVHQAMRNGIFIALSLSLMIGWGMILLLCRISFSLQQKKAGADGKSLSSPPAWRAALPGLMTVLAVTAVFSGMLLLLENRTNASASTTNNRELLSYEIEWRREQEGIIRKDFEDYYRQCTQVLAAYLMEHPEYRTREGLAEMSKLAGTSYLMLFGRDGKEIAASNSYTGFTAEKNLDEVFQSVLLGYPSAIVGPSPDPYTGRMQFSSARLLKDAEGQPDGFLLAVFDGGDLKAALTEMSYENTVNSFTVRKGCVAAAVSVEDGRFIAHTDPDMIGQKAEDFLEDYDPATSFEGFSAYRGQTVSVSATSRDGKTLLFLAPEREDSRIRVIALLMLQAEMLFLALLFYPLACALLTKATAEAKLPADWPLRVPFGLISRGYAFFLTLFTFFVIIASSNGWWSSFDYVLSGNWTAGVHLYSLWGALFILAATLTCEALIQWALHLMENRLSTQGRTVSRLVGSLVTYAACLFLFFRILSLFGVNTATLVTSAGIISIAVGMGAQSMAADLLAGFFMMVEGSVQVGDTVNVGGFVGRVTNMGIRAITVTDDEGNFAVINNNNLYNSRTGPMRNLTPSQEKKDPEEKKAQEEKKEPEKDSPAKR